MYISKLVECIQKSLIFPMLRNNEMKSLTKLQTNAQIKALGNLNEDENARYIIR